MGRFPQWTDDSVLNPGTEGLPNEALGLLQASDHLPVPVCHGDKAR